MAAVAVNEIRKKFGDVVAVNGISLEARDGEFMVLLGPSGCGKTTLLRIIAGLEKPTSGQVLIDGQVVNDMPPRGRGIAMVFQSYGLYPHLTVWNNIAFPLRTQGTARAEIKRKVEWAAGLLGIDHLAQRRPRELSGGERQRVALARALVRDPTVFLLDEPLSNLDAKLRASARSELKQFQRTVRTATIYVTHDQVEAMGMGDRIAVMDHGTLRQVGSPTEIHELVRRMLVDFSRAPDLPQCAVVHHRDAIAHPHGLDLIVRHIDGGGAHSPLELLELASGARAQLRVEVRQRLIQQEYRWATDQRPRECDTLALAAGKLARAPLRKVVDPEQTGCPLDLAFDLGARRALGPQREGDVVPNRQVRIEPVALKHHGDAAPARRHVVDHLAIDQDLPGRGLLQTRDDSEQRGLAASRRPEQHHEFAVARLQADAVDSHHVPELFSDLVDSNRGHVDSLDVPGRASAAFRLVRSTREGLDDEHVARTAAKSTPQRGSSPHFVSLHAGYRSGTEAAGRVAATRVGTRPGAKLKLAPPTSCRSARSPSEPMRLPPPASPGRWPPWPSCRR